MVQVIRRQRFIGFTQRCLQLRLLTGSRKQLHAKARHHLLELGDVGLGVRRFFAGFKFDPHGGGQRGNTRVVCQMWRNG